MSRPARDRPAREAREAPVVLAALTVLFFCSGAVALVYQVLWQRRFAAVFGSAAPATAAVLAAFFAGLGAGSWCIGALARRWRRPLRAFAALEAAIGAGAWLVAPLLAALEGALPRLLTAFVAVAAPTFCMGGTLPALAGFVDRGRQRLGLNAGRLYAANTAGAALGALAVPFLLLPALGAAGTLRLCVIANVALALAALALDRVSARRGASPVGHPATGKGKPDPRSLLPLLLASALSGAASFVFEVSWNRAFAQVHANSLHAFAVIVAVFIAALAGGAELARQLLRRDVRPERLLGWAWISAGALAVLGCWTFVRWTDGLASGGEGGLVRLAGLALAVVFPPVALAGAGLPALMEQAGRAKGVEPGRALGTLLACNVAGCVAGALLAGFVLPGWLGLWGGMLVAASALVVAGAWWLGGPAKLSTRFARATVVAVLAAGIWAVAIRDWPRVHVEDAAGERLVDVAEGPHGIVAVVERPGSRRLKLNNAYVLGGTASTADERMQVHLPLLLHPAPSRVALLGLGTGISAGAARFHPVERLAPVELVPEVVEAAAAHFAQENRGVASDPAIPVIVDDARSFLRRTPERFDVIVGDLVVPWRQGESAMYAVEQFAAAKRALAPQGLFCQWLPLFQLGEADVALVARTFLAVFGRATVWRGDFSAEEPAVALIGGLGGSAPDPAIVARRVAQAEPDPTNPHLGDPFAVWMHFVGVLEAGDAGGADAPLHGDDTPWLELGGARGGGGCVERCLERWLAEVRRASAGRPTALGARERAALEAGELLSSFALAFAEGDEARARELHARLAAALPPAVFDAIFAPRARTTKPA